MYSCLFEDVIDRAMENSCDSGLENESIDSSCFSMDELRIKNLFVDLVNSIAP